MSHIEYRTAFADTGRLRRLALRFGDDGIDKRRIDDIVDCGTDLDRYAVGGVDGGSSDTDADPVGFDGAV